MADKLPSRYRVVCFAAIMSCLTSMLVSLTVVSLRVDTVAQFYQVWPATFLLAWPLVFISILCCAPKVNQLINLIVEA